MVNTKSNIKSKKTILYAVAGEGMGHAIRSVVIIKHLLKNHNVVIVSSDRAYSYFSSKFKDVYRLEGLHFVYENNEINIIKTLFNIMKNSRSIYGHNMSILKHLIKKYKPNLVISDFEMFSNLICKFKRIPLISIDNEHIMNKCKLKGIPLKYQLSMFNAKVVTRLLTLLAKRYLITTYFYLPVINKRAKLFPPILRDEILKAKTSLGNHILVYQTSDSYGKLLPVLKKIDQKFIIYGLKQDKVDGNLILRKFNEDRFIKELASAKAVITNGGFTFIGEALYHKKPVLCVPVKKQFEQFLNAFYVQKLGYGDFYEDLSKEKVERFISKLSVYRKNLDKYPKEDNSKILNEVDKVVEKYSKKN